MYEKTMKEMRRHDFQLLLRRREGQRLTFIYWSVRPPNWHQPKSQTSFPSLHVSRILTFRLSICILKNRSTQKISGFLFVCLFGGVALGGVFFVLFCFLFLFCFVLFY